jgi:hypothetical protein
VLSLLHDPLEKRRRVAAERIQKRLVITREFPGNRSASLFRERPLRPIALFSHRETRLLIRDVGLSENPKDPERFQTVVLRAGGAPAIFATCGPEQVAP